jgi:hypothetical protein
VVQNINSRQKPRVSRSPSCGGGEQGVFVENSTHPKPRGVWRTLGFAEEDIRMEANVKAMQQ